ncbi:class I SAM-dependent methyltransferase [Patescibacteria group bacterium]|jgi:ubiquinone/menaquinone biosynthesis C-methylase UbiE|nr:class I SAM-dependent methyltransferase [Patescibacteria group bacterium]MCL5114630.1 class I SAM-dependent methyltransferase [Patescibacteria group bacterium]
MPSAYDDYRYDEFWRGRDYEKEADFMAVKKLFSAMPSQKGLLLDIGAGNGRMVSLYENDWKKFILLDSSKEQLIAARERVTEGKNVRFLIASSWDMPLPNGSCDAALCVRMFHYIDNPRKTIAEISRVVKPGGYLILEIPNKVHFKNRLRALMALLYAPSLFWNLLSRESVDHSSYDDIPFVNHHPRTIASLLEWNDFIIETTLSVSNFRSPLMKKAIPLSLLLLMENHFQRPLAKFFFGPSVYFLARKL